MYAGDGLKVSGGGAVVCVTGRSGGGGGTAHVVRLVKSRPRHGQLCTARSAARCSPSRVSSLFDMAILKAAPAGVVWLRHRV